MPLLDPPSGVEGSSAESGEDKELTSGILDRRDFRARQDPGTNEPPAESKMRARQPSAPLVEIGDPITYDGTLEDSYDGTLPGDSQRDIFSSHTVPRGLWDDPTRGIADDATADGDDDDDDYEDDPYLGTTISDRYVLDDVIGEGGMGRVYRAHHKIIGKSVAIKILHAELARDKGAVGRFVREAQAASSIGNAHIVDVADFGETEDGSTYFVMEYLDGVTLTELLEEKGSLEPELVCDLALQLADGLAAAHDQKIVHRDLKPDNITLVARGSNQRFCKILDFGIAKVNTSSSSTKLTMAGAVFGTPHYMSPEQAAGAAVDNRTDIYSLGVIMYEMTSGQLPFNADNFMGILTQHMYKAPVPLRALTGAPECPPGLEAVILKCLSKKPDARYATMTELAADLQRVQAGEVPAAVHDMMARSGGFNVPADYFQSGAGVVSGASKKKLRPSQLVMFAGIAAATGLVMVVLLKNSLSDAQPPPRDATAAIADAPPTAMATEVESVDVMLASNAPAATALVGDARFPLPKLFTVKKGEPLEVRIVARGFADKVIALDGSEKEVKVVQQAILGPRPVTTDGDKPPPPRPHGRPPPAGAGNKPAPKPVDGVVDPWGK